MSKKIKVVLTFGTRPEAIKMAPLWRHLRKNRYFNVRLLLTGQHRRMLDQVIDFFDMKVDADLNIMMEKQSLYEVTSRALKGLEVLYGKEKPDIVLVHGDTTTTLAAALAAFYKRIPIGHVEAGLRTYDLQKPYPEEANRQLTDRICNIHFAPTLTSRKNLIGEGIRPEYIFVTGNTVIDSLCWSARRVGSFEERSLKNLPEKQMVLITLHRRENWGKPLEEALRAIKRLAREYVGEFLFVYPVHLNPHVSVPAGKILQGEKNIMLTSPVCYPDMVALMKRCYLVITDSGGIQEEAPAFGKPVVVLRDVTERPEAVRAGTVVLAGLNFDKIYRTVKRLIEDRKKYSKMAHAVNPYGDGKASGRITDALEYYFGLRKKRPKEFSRSPFRVREKRALFKVTKGSKKRGE